MANPKINHLRNHQKWFVSATPKWLVYYWFYHNVCQGVSRSQWLFSLAASWKHFCIGSYETLQIMEFFWGDTPFTNWCQISSVHCPPYLKKNCMVFADSSWSCGKAVILICTNLARRKNECGGSKSIWFPWRHRVWPREVNRWGCHKIYQEKTYLSHFVSFNKHHPLGIHTEHNWLEVLPKCQRQIGSEFRRTTTFTNVCSYTNIISLYRNVYIHIYLYIHTYVRTYIA